MKEKLEEIVHFGAIDIGSNAARLLISSVNLMAPKQQLQKAILLRIPLRLGQDVFANGKISEKKAKDFMLTMKAFANLLKVYKVKSMRAYATSAMRDAENGANLSDEIRDKTGIEIEIIDGKKEASIIYESHLTDMFSTKHNYVYVDVGGGSTEVSMIKKGKMKTSTSFNIGTLRLLANKVKDSEWDNLTMWLKNEVNDKNTEIIGLGGNINKLNRLADVGKKLPVDVLEKWRNQLDSLTVAERMLKYGMRLDRADVIVPAANIFLHIAQVSGIKKINVPTLGLVDGINQQLFDSANL